MKKMRKTLAFVLVFAVVVSLFATFSIVGQAYTTPGNVSVATARQRISSLWSIMSKKYFTINQSGCVSSGWKGNHGCTNCTLDNIIGTSWFKNTFNCGNLSVYQFPITYHDGGPFDLAGMQSCAAFAEFAEWYIYKSSNTDKVTSVNVVTTNSITYADMQKYARVGDIIRIQTSGGGHSGIVVSWNSSWIEVLDCNFNVGGDLNCRVNLHTISYSWMQDKGYTHFTLSRASNSVVTGDSSGTGSSGITGPNPDDYTVPTRNIAYNGTFATGSDVMWVQAVLYQLGYSIDVDGKYGNDSKNLVMQFQSKYGLEVDGVVGANTVIKMQELWAAKKSELAEKKIVFNANGGTFKSGTTITKTATSGKFTVPDEIPTRDGFDFICWIDKVGGTYYYQGRGSYDIASNMELHALWMKSAYRINLDPNGGEFRYKTILTIPVSGKNRARGLAESIIYNSAYGETSSTNEYGVEYAVDEYGLVTDYASYGKNNMSIPTNGFVISLHAENSCFYMATELIKKGTSYAYYDSSANMIYIFDSNEDYIAYTRMQKSPDEAIFIADIVPQKTGYTFLGWSSAKDAETVEYKPQSICSLPTGSTIYAVWDVADHGKVVSISVESMPTRTEYNKGEEFSSDGLTLLATYEDGKTKIITSGFTVSGFDSSSVGEKTLTVSFEGKAVTFKISVVMQYDWTDWVPVSEVPESILKNEKGHYVIEYADGYRVREKSTVTNGYSSLDGWTLDSKAKTGTSYGSWQLNRPSASDNQGATEHTVVSVETKNVYDSYAWVNSAHDYYWHSVTHSRYTNEIHIYSSARNFTVDSDNAFICPATISPSNPGGFGQVFIMTDNGNSISSFTSNASDKHSYFWAANGNRDIYRTVTEKYQYTYSKWSDWSDFSMTPAEASATVEVETISNGFVRYRATRSEESLPTFTIKTVSLSLSDSVAIHFKVEASVYEAYENVYAMISCDGDVKRVEGVLGSDGRYWFSYRNLTPNMAKVPVEMTLYGTGNGQEYTKTVSYSIYKYCQSLYKNSDDKVKTFVVDFLNYAAALQEYTNYNVDDLANVGFDQSYASSTLTAPVNQFNGRVTTIDNPTVAWKGIGLAIKDVINTRVKFQADDITGLSIRFTINGTDYNVTEFTPVEGTENQYYAYFGKTLPNEMRTAFTFTAYRDGVAVSNTAQYSIQSYAAQVGVDTNSALGKVLDAMLKYGDSCAVAFG